MNFLKTLFAHWWAPFALLGAVLLLAAAASYLAPSCSGPEPAGKPLSRAQLRRLGQQRAAGLAVARADSARAVRLVAYAATLRATAKLLDDSATYYATHAKALSLPAADSSSLPRFWANFFR